MSGPAGQFSSCRVENVVTCSDRRRSYFCNQTASQIANQVATGDGGNVVQVIIQIAQQQTATAQDTTTARETNQMNETKVEDESGETGVEQEDQIEMEEQRMETDYSGTNSTDDDRNGSDDSG